MTEFKHHQSVLALFIQNSQVALFEIKYAIHRAVIHRPNILDRASFLYKGKYTWKYVTARPEICNIPLYKGMLEHISAASFTQLVQHASVCASLTCINVKEA